MIGILDGINDYAFNFGQVSEGMESFTRESSIFNGADGEFNNAFAHAYVSAAIALDRNMALAYIGGDIRELKSVISHNANSLFGWENPESPHPQSTPNHCPNLAKCAPWSTAMLSQKADFVSMAGEFLWGYLDC